LLELNGSDLRKLPIEDRRAKLAHLLRISPDGVIFSEAVAGDGPVVHAHACRLGVEGIVSKRRGLALSIGSRPRVAKDAMRGIQARVTAKVINARNRRGSANE
jgi:ATP-dependent DNA ligase